MSELALMNGDMVKATSNLANQRITDLNREVVDCRDCPRLGQYRESGARAKKKRFLSCNYWGRPVPGFGDIAASIFGTGLAPAPHGGGSHRKGVPRGLKALPPLQGQFRG